jgi:hypothetical protein
VAILPDEVPTAVISPPGQAEPAAPARRSLPEWLRRTSLGPQLRDTLALCAYAAGAFWVLAHLIIDPNGRIIAANSNDQAFFEWTLAHGLRVLTHGANPFFTTQLGAPAGVNLMANTSILGLTLPLAPVTALAGPRAAFLVLLLLGLVATAASWYAFFSRAMRLGRGPAFLGAALCGFGPAMVAHANAHPNIVAQFLLPWIFWQLLALSRGIRPTRSGLILAALVVWQFFINEELLFITGLTFLLFGLAWLAQRPVASRQAVTQLAWGLLLPTGVVLLVVGYPLYFQFFGPQHYRGMPPAAQDFGTDLVAFVAFSSRSLGGNPVTIGNIAQNAAEENIFLGVPLLALMVLCCWYLRRRPAIPALGVAAGVLALFSLGVHLRVQGTLTALYSPYLLLHRVPIFDTVIPTRLGLAITPIAGALLAIGLAHARTAVRSLAPALAGPLRGIGIAVLIGALLPLTPTPIRAVSGQPIPEFISSGAWRDYVPDGAALVTVPLPQPYDIAAMRWAALTGDQLRLAGGYFLGPTDDPKHPDDLRAVFTPTPRPTAHLFDEVVKTRKIPAIGPQQLAQFRADMAYWHAKVVLLTPRRLDALLWETVTALVGAAPVWIGGVWLWQVGSLR